MNAPSRDQLRGVLEHRMRELAVCAFALAATHDETDLILAMCFADRVTEITRALREPPN